MEWALTFGFFRHRLPAMRILLVEDEKKLAGLVRKLMDVRGHPASATTVSGRGRFPHIRGPAVLHAFRLKCGLLSVCLLALVATAAADSATQAWSLRTWRSDEGLPENVVVGVDQAPDGFLWIATEYGLVRFDGVRFLDVDLATPDGLFTGANHGILRDRSGRLWLVKERGGMVCADGTQAHLFPPGHELHDFPVMQVVADGDGGFWFSGVGGRVFRIHESAVNGIATPVGGRCWMACDNADRLWLARGRFVTVYRNGQVHPMLKLSERLRGIAVARSGGIWIVAGRRLMKLAEGEQPIALGELPANLQSPSNITVLYEDRGGALWIGTAQGLFRYDGSTFADVPTSDPNIVSVIEDHEGSIWVGTRGGGLNRLRPRVVEYAVLGPDRRDTPVFSVCEDTAGNIWAAAGTRVLRRSRDDARPTFSTNETASLAYPRCVAADPRGGVWIGTRYAGLFSCRDGMVRRLSARQDGLAGNHVRCLLVAASGDVWIGTDRPVALQRLRGEHIRTFDLPARSGPVCSMTMDAAGDLWASTSGGALLRVNNDTLVDETPATLPAPSTIHCVYATPDGSLWIGYAGKGLGRLKAGRFTRFDVEAGLYDNYISQIVADGDDRLWFAGNRGIFSVRQEEFDALTEGRGGRLRPVVYGKSAGLPDLQPSHGCGPGALFSKDGCLWFPMQTGLAVVDPVKIVENRKPPPVVMERVTIEGRTVAVYRSGVSSTEAPSPRVLDLRLPGAHVRLPPGSRQVEFEFTALSFAAPENVAFKYRMEGLDREWVQAGSQRVAAYGHIPPGNYRFRVSACNNDAVWNQTGTSLALTVLPHFWQTWWFRIAVALAFMGAVGGAVRHIERRRARRRIEQLERDRAIQNERERIARDIHDEIGSKLTEISMLSELAQGEDVPPDEAQAELRTIAGKTRVLTGALSEIVWAVDPSEDTLDSFVAYACDYAEDYLKLGGVRCRLEIPDNLPPLALSAEVRHNLFLVVKEAVHNIVKHACASEVWIRVELRPGGFALEIEDDGKGFDTGADPQGWGHGLTNMPRRVEAIGGRFVLSSQPAGGTRVRMALDVPEAG